VGRPSTPHRDPRLHIARIIEDTVTDASTRVRPRTARSRIPPRRTILAGCARSSTPPSSTTGVQARDRQLPSREPFVALLLAVLRLPERLMVQTPASGTCAERRRTTAGSRSCARPQRFLGRGMQRTMRPSASPPHLAAGVLHRPPRLRGGSPGCRDHQPLPRQRSGRVMSRTVSTTFKERHLNYERSASVSRPSPTPSRQLYRLFPSYPS